MREVRSFKGRGRAGSAKRYRPLVIETRWQSLGVSCGDYSLAGYEPKRDDAPAKISIERKSVADLVGTVIGFKSNRRDRFERELQNLSTLNSSLVICEGTMTECMIECQTDKSQKAFYHSVIALQQDFRVPWIFCTSRRVAEITAFRWLERFHSKITEAAEAARTATAGKAVAQ